MKILIACEESQAVCVQFRKLGHEAYSCDILPESGGHPEWHIQGYLEDHIGNGNDWDMIIAFPPCTHLAVSGARHFKQKREDGRQEYAINFFMMIANNGCEKIAIENPIGIMSSLWRKPDQIIQPWYFGDEAQKTTCLWLKGLPPLFHAKAPDLFNDKITHVDPGEFHYWKDGKTGKTKKQPKWYADAFLNAKSKEEVGHIRSKTFPGIAKAMAEQWGSTE